MRISLSRKILIIYALLLSFSLLQGVLLYLSIDNYRLYNALQSEVIEFKFQIKELQNIKTGDSHIHEHVSNDTEDIHTHAFFTEKYLASIQTLEQISDFKLKLTASYYQTLNEAEEFLANYNRAFFEMHDLIHKDQIIHNKIIRNLEQLRGLFADLDPSAAENLFFILLEDYTIKAISPKNTRLEVLPKLRKLKKDISLLTSSQKSLSVIQNIIELIEVEYINSLAILDKEDFLNDSADHLVNFSDATTTSLTKDADLYQERIKISMISLIVTAMLITFLIYLYSRRYILKFLKAQQFSIDSISAGNYTYEIPYQSQDELGDLTIFLRGMANVLRQSETKIRESEKHVRLLLNSTSEAIYGLDMEGKCTFCNNAFLAIMGYESEKELLGKNVHDLIHHTKLDGSPYPWDECVAHRGFLEGKGTHSLDEVFYRKDGSSFYAECWSHPIRDKGEITGAVVTFLDISKRKEALHQLKNSEELYRTLIENIDLGITLINKDHSIIMTNSAQGDFFGRKSSSFVGRKCFREFEKREDICPHCPGITAMETGKPQEIITEGVRDDASTFTVRIKAFPVHHEIGETYGFIEVVEDVSDKLKAEQELANEKERLAVTLRSIGDGVITTDINGNVNLMNRVAEEMCGWKQPEALGKPLSEVFNITDEVTGEPCENPITKILASGQTVTLANHTVLVSRDGTRRNIADSGAAIRDRQSQIIGVVLVFRDVTEENIREKELIKGKKLESIGVLAGGIAHDFNNILSAILGNINLVRHIIPSNEQRAQVFLEEAEKASLRAQNLTQQLLTFSKGGEPIKRTASLPDIIKESTQFVLRGTNIKYEYDIPEDTWKVDVDPGQISQVIQNIVLNARHAMPGGGTLRIFCTNIRPGKDMPIVLHKDKKYVMVNISDTGIGIPSKVIDNIFDPYFSTKKDGSGLGLSICHSIIEKHNGYISAKSKQGEGTTFTFYIPASTDQVVEQEAEHHEAVFSQKDLTVIIMDDDDQILKISEAMLTHLGCTTLLAKDGEEAIQLYRESMEQGDTIDIVIMDLTIPGGMGGKEAVEEILKIDPDARVIVSSGYSNDPIMADFKKYGFCASVVKPYQLKEIAEVIDAVSELGDS